MRASCVAESRKLRALIQRTAHREFWGIEAIRRWVARELVGDRVTGDTVVRGRYDGDYDKTNLPDELILTNYFTVRRGTR